MLPKVRKATFAPLARWAFVAVSVLMGAALLVTVWTTYAGVRGAAESLARGQADTFLRALRGHLRALGRPPADEDLAVFLEEQSSEGLLYLAVLGPDGSPVAQAGSPLGDRAAVRQALWGRAPGTPVHVGGRMTVLLAARPQRRAFGRHGRAVPAAIVEFEPRQARELRATAVRTVGIGGLAAAVLLVAALGLARWWQRRDAIERELERGRHLASLGQLSAVLAHEIRNPLASLKGNAQLLAQQLPPGERPRAKADRVVEEAVRLEALTNDLLDFARTGALARESVDPAELLREAAAAAGGEGIEVEAAAAPAAWTLDPTRIGRVLQNLLDNALQAGAPVRARVAADAGGLVYEIRDAGPGIAEDELERIFEPFYTRRTRGTGLGLAIVKRAVELHGGRVSAANHPAGGAVLRVWLPGG